MTQKRKSLTLERHNITDVFISREYLEQLGIMAKVIEAAETENFTKVYEALIADAKEYNDINLLKIIAGGHSIRANTDGITFIKE